MTKMQQAIITINSFSMGILLPVFNLVLLEKGSNLQTLPLLLAIYSTTVLCLELPSGICADIYGRKAVYLLSCGFLFISSCLMFAANNMVWLIFTITFFGLGRAFSSGSLDALFIDYALALHGEDCLAKVTSRIAVLDGAGLAVGCIVGGFISNLAGNYLVNIILRAVLTVMLFIMCLVFIKEQPIHAREKHTSLIDHIRKGKQVLFSTPKFGFIFMGIFFTGFLLCAIETYWQPAFMQLPTMQNSTWVLGFIAFLGFLAVAFGNIIVQKLLDKYSRSWWNVYNICRIIFAICILVFAFQKKNTGFVLWYAGVYLLLGASNVAESTLINKLTPNNMRASVLSLSSLTAQIGALCASVFSSIMILRLEFSGIWIIAGGLLGGYAIIMTAITNKNRQESSDKAEMTP